MWSHEQSVTDCQDWCAINHHAIKKFCSFNNQLAEEWPCKNLSGIRRASSTGKDEQLAAGRSKNVARQRNVLIHKLEFASWNLARCRGDVGLTDQAIRDSRRGVFIGIIFAADLGESKNLVHVRPTQVAVDEKHAITLLSQCKCIIRAGETFSFARQSAGEQ